MYDLRLDRLRAWIAPFVGFRPLGTSYNYVQIYACLFRVRLRGTYEKKMAISSGEENHELGKIAIIRDKKPHVYRVIILKQMADHSQRDSQIILQLNG